LPSFNERKEEEEDIFSMNTSQFESMLRQQEEKEKCSVSSLSIPNGPPLPLSPLPLPLSPPAVPFTFAPPLPLLLPGGNGGVSSRRDVGGLSTISSKDLASISGKESKHSRPTRRLSSLLTAVEREYNKHPLSYNCSPSSPSTTSAVKLPQRRAKKAAKAKFAFASAIIKATTNEKKKKKKMPHKELTSRSDKDQKESNCLKTSDEQQQQTNDSDDGDDDDDCDDGETVCQVTASQIKKRRKRRIVSSSSSAESGNRGSTPSPPYYSSPPSSPRPSSYRQHQDSFNKKKKNKKNSRPTEHGEDYAKQTTSDVYDAHVAASTEDKGDAANA